jgi:hypothetical protein
MAPSAPEQAAKDRTAVKLTLDNPDTEMVDHITAPLDEAGIDFVIWLPANA